MTLEAVRTRVPLVENPSPVSNYPQTAEQARQIIEEELNKKKSIYGWWTEPVIWSYVPEDCFTEEELGEERLPIRVISASWKGKQRGVRGERATGILTIEEEGPNGLPRIREVFLIESVRYQFPEPSPEPNTDNHLL